MAEKYNIKYNLMFSRVGPMMICVAMCSLIELPHSIWGQIAVASFILACLLFLINYFYVWRCIFKTPVPDHLLLEPPKYYYRIFNTKMVDNFIRRRYSTGGKARFRLDQAKAFYTQNKKLV